MKTVFHAQLEVTLKPDHYPLHITDIVQYEQDEGDPIGIIVDDSATKCYVVEKCALCLQGTTSLGEVTHVKEEVAEPFVFCPKCGVKL